MKVIDSSGWLELLADGPNAGIFEEAMREVSELVVPSITVYEVFKRMTQQLDESSALRAVAVMQQGQIAELTSPIAISAAQLSIRHSLPMADAIILATAKNHRAELWTMDADFEGIAGVKYVPKHP